MSIISKSQTLILRRYWARERINYSVRVFVALSCCILPCWYFDVKAQSIPLFLGVLAAALAETDDNLPGRLRALGLTLPIFFIATCSVELLHDKPLLFGITIFLSTFGYTMLGALGARYNSIAFSALLIGIYDLLGAATVKSIWLQPTLLTTGAAIYGICSLAWLILWPLRPVQQSLEALFYSFANYLDAKSELFIPVEAFDDTPFQKVAGELTTKMVDALDVAKLTLLSRTRRTQPGSANTRMLQIYLIGQDIHDRITSSHYRYLDLSQAFYHSDILFRFNRLLRLMAGSCRDAGNAFALGEQFQVNPIINRALKESAGALAILREKDVPEWRPLLLQLDFLYANLHTLTLQLSVIAAPDIPIRQEEQDLLDDTPHGLLDMWHRIKDQLTVRSMLFRHALRLSIALTVGYITICLFNLTNGYWIMLTTLFTCLPNYSAMRYRLIQRIYGTLIGLFTGTVLLYLFPDLRSQLPLIMASGIIFFAFRTTPKPIATAAITVFVLLSFNQFGEAFVVILPRLGDTLYGCLLASLAVSFIFPDWQADHLLEFMADSVDANRLFMKTVIHQYSEGRHDDLNYRIARRKAHRVDAVLSTAVSNMQKEPGTRREASEDSFRFLTLSHSLLSYISALGGHRVRIADKQTHKLISDASCYIDVEMQRLIAILKNRKEEVSDEARAIERQQLRLKLRKWRDMDNAESFMILQQFFLIHRLLPEMNDIASRLSSGSLERAHREGR
ncbi:MAG: YccS family putative transporter [Desulforhopalus sp.]|nr:YccS family putative transporter [Desulforhopalus sp.]